jgi:hypothetical protein
VLLTDKEKLGAEERDVLRSGLLRDRLRDVPRPDHSKAVGRPAGGTGA